MVGCDNTHGSRFSVRASLSYRFALAGEKLGWTPVGWGLSTWCVVGRRHVRGRQE